MITKRGTFIVSKHFSGVSIAVVENYWALLSEFLEGAVEQIPLGEQTGSR